MDLLAATSQLQAAAASVVAATDIRAVWPLVQINVWGREQLRVLVLTDTCLYRVRVDGSDLSICEQTLLSNLHFVVKGYLCYPKGTIVDALDGTQAARVFALRLYTTDGKEEHRTFRALEVSDEMGMRATIMHVIDELTAAARAVKNTRFFIADHDITLSARLGPFAFLRNRMSPAAAAGMQLAPALAAVRSVSPQPVAAAAAAAAAAVGISATTDSADSTASGR